MIDALELRLAALIAQLEPAARSSLARAMAKHMQERQRRRIAAQRNPDGSAYAPRKPRLRKQKGSIRRTLFAKLRTARYLKAESTADAATVTFAPAAQRIAQVHQLGLRDRVERRIAASTVQYPVRELLGFSDDDRDLISQMVIEHLAK